MSSLARSWFRLLRRWILLSACALLVGGSATVPPASGATRVLYSTDFEAFPTGDDQLVGFDGWAGDNTGERVHGIDADIVAGLGQSAFLGFSPPSDAFVRVYRPVDYDPVAEGTPEIEFFALLGLQESTAGADDYFYITVLNSERQALAAVRFQAGPDGIQTWRFDGATMHPEIGGLTVGVVAPVLVRIDFAKNQWSVTWDGVPVLADALFTATETTRDLGAVAAEWQLAEPSNPGNNWLLFDGWTIEAVLSTDVVLTGAGANPDGSYSLTWEGEVGQTFVVEYSTDLTDWLRDLPGAEIEVVAGGTVTFTDTTSARDSGRRFYRVVRLGGG